MPKEEGYKTEIIALKFLDIFLLSGYYFIAGFFIASAIDFVIGKFSSQDDEIKPTWQLFAEAIWYTFVLLVVFYIVRNIIERIPFPFDGLYGFQHSRVKERTGDVIFVFILFYYQEFYVQKLKFLHNRLVNEAKQIQAKYFS
jgi:hypothetical protein